MNAQLPMFEEPNREPGHVPYWEGPQLSAKRLDVAPLTGEQLKTVALAAHERRHGEWLTAVRKAAMLHAFTHGTVNADDIAHIPLPEGASPNVRGAIFNCPEFVFVGFVRSKRPEAHANRLNSYALALKRGDEE